MSTVELGVRLSTNELLRAIDRLDTADRFFSCKSLPNLI